MSTPRTTTSISPMTQRWAARSRSTSRTSTSSRGSAISRTTAKSSARSTLRWRRSRRTRTSKLLTLKKRILDKVEAPLNPGNNKVLVFSAFADTADYLYRELQEVLAGQSLEVAIVTGKNAPRTTLGKGFGFQQILTLFSPRSKQRELAMPKETREIDVLIGTDCISEGQNLQDCDFVVNYDIHWNPVRIIQRFGRVDRIGSTNATIQMVNFWPDITLDEYINLKERVENRMVIADVTATADDNPLNHESNDVAVPQGAAASPPGRSYRARGRAHGNRDHGPWA